MVLILAVLLAEVACKTIYYHPTKSSQDFNRELLQCQAVAKQMMGSRWVVGDQTQVAGAQIGWAIEERRYVDQCLRAEGWTTDKPGVSTNVASQHIQNLQNAARNDLAGLQSRNISEGSCQIGFAYFPNRWIVLGVSPIASDAGLRVGDRVLSVAGRRVSDLSGPNALTDALRSSRAGDRVYLAVARGSSSQELSLPCRDAWPTHSAALATAEAMLRGQWDDCLDGVNRIESLVQIEPSPAFSAQVRMNCALAKAESLGHPVGWPEAELAYEWRRRLIRDAHVADAIGEIRGDVLKVIQTFRQQGFTTLADDLEASLKHPGVEGPIFGSQESPPTSEGNAKAGTCFAIDSSGQIATAYHVIEGARSIAVRFGTAEVLVASVVSVSRANDLAVLTVDRRTKDFLPLAPKHSAHVGQRVFTIGYPMVDLLGEEPKFTDGTISALTGPGGEVSVMQISVPVQPGNSGGPLVDERGLAVGVLTSTAAAANFLMLTGTLPQNVNWAVSADFLSAIARVDDSLPPTSREGAIERARSAVCQIEASRG